MEKCYMCNNSKSSVEHTPPKCFFPTDMRINLITVPSCTTHNENMSSEDEYVRNVITMSIANNTTSIEQFFDKSLKSFRRNPKITNQIIDSLRDVNFYKKNAKAFQIDRIKFDRVIRKIAYALFYKEFDKTWERLLAVTTNQLKNQHMKNDHLGLAFEYLMELGTDYMEFKGENPSVFRYAFVKNENIFESALFMVFYEGFPFWIIPDHDTNSASFD